MIHDPTYSYRDTEERSAGKHSASFPSVPSGIFDAPRNTLGIFAPRNTLGIFAPRNTLGIFEAKLQLGYDKCLDLWAHLRGFELATKRIHIETLKNAVQASTQYFRGSNPVRLRTWLLKWLVTQVNY